MLVIRFFRTGKKNQPFFKIVVTEKNRPPRGGRFVEELGFYNPLTKEKNLKAERVKYWFSVGAKPSDTVFNLLVKEGIIEGKKIAKHKKKVREKKETEAPPAAPAGAAPGEAGGGVAEETQVDTGSLPAEEKSAEGPETAETPKKSEKPAKAEKPGKDGPPLVEKSSEGKLKEKPKEEKPAQKVDKE